MPYRFRFSLLLALLLTVHATSAATPHPGGLDAYGCHHDHQQGDYHCHQGQFTGQSFASQSEMQAARQQNYTTFPRISRSVNSPARSSPFSTATRLKSSTIPTLSVSASATSIALRKAKPSVTERSRLCQR